ncbi:MAG: hypothetical protein AABW64_00090 [Nanoarchaeota archaeon]
MVGKKQKQEKDNTLSSKQQSLTSLNLQKVAHEENIAVARIKELVDLLKKKYQLTTRDIIHLTDEGEIFIPLSIFTKKLSALEVITRYLKEELNCSYHRIGILLNRNEKNIWHTYHHALKKYPDKLNTQRSQHSIPISIFKNDLGVLENIVLYLKDELNLSYHKIAVLLERDDRTIWTMYQRARKKKT